MPDHSTLASAAVLLVSYECLTRGSLTRWLVLGVIGLRACFIWCDVSLRLVCNGAGERFRRAWVEARYGSEFQEKGE